VELIRNKIYFAELNNIFNKSDNPKMLQTVEIYKIYYKLQIIVCGPLSYNRLSLWTFASSFPRKTLNLLANFGYVRLFSNFLFLYKVGLAWSFLVEERKFQTPTLDYIKMTVIIFLKKYKNRSSCSTSFP